MIHRTFEGFKLTRIYLGGSKKKEKDIFSTVQDVENDYLACDWLEFRRIIVKYWDDILHVIHSWEIILKLITLFLLISSILLFKYQHTSLILFSISIIFFSIYSYIKQRRIHILKMYGFTLSITNDKIKELFGFDSLV
jgi:hypothetical protein